MCSSCENSCEERWRLSSWGGSYKPPALLPASTGPALPKQRACPSSLLGSWSSRTASRNTHARRGEKPHETGPHFGTFAPLPKLELPQDAARRWAQQTLKDAGWNPTQ